MVVPALIVLSFATLALGQRPFFAGHRPIGFPEVTTESLGDRFGEIDGTTQRLPVEANGDRELVDRLSKLPVEQQPFWFINWQALEAHRQNPQTYPQKPNPFIDPPQTNGGSNSGNIYPGNTNFNSGNVYPNTGNVYPNTGNANPTSGSITPNTGNQTPNSGNVNNNAGNAISSANHSGSGTTNRFGVEEHPNNQDPIENAFTNSSAGTITPNFSNSSTEKKTAPPKDNKVNNTHKY